MTFSPRVGAGLRGLGRLQPDFGISGPKLTLETRGLVPSLQGSSRWRSGGIE